MRASRRAGLIFTLDPSRSREPFTVARSEEPVQIVSYRAERRSISIAYPQIEANDRGSARARARTVGNPTFTYAKQSGWRLN